MWRRPPGAVHSARREAFLQGARDAESPHVNLGGHLVGREFVAKGGAEHVVIKCINPPVLLKNDKLWSIGVFFAMIKASKEVNLHNIPKENT